MSLKNTWSLKLAKKKLLPRPPRLLPISYSSLHRERYIPSHKRWYIFTTQNWNFLSRCWKKALPQHSYSITSNIRFNGFLTNSQRRLFCKTTTSNNGVMARLSYWWRTHNPEVSGLTYNVTLANWHNVSGMTYLTRQRTTFKLTRESTGKVRLNQSLSTTSWRKTLSTNRWSKSWKVK